MKIKLDDPKTLPDSHTIVLVWRVKMWWNHQKDCLVREINGWDFPAIMYRDAPIDEPNVIGSWKLFFQETDVESGSLYGDVLAVPTRIRNDDIWIPLPERPKE